MIDLFSLRDTRDELGMGSIRDAWADRLVPGTSTIQTRARYFLFVPWMYRWLEEKGERADRVARVGRKAELELINAIERTDPDAVPIGARAGAKLKRLPSSIYWNGMRQLRILLFAGSQERYHRSFAGGRAREWAMGEGESMETPNWNPHLPPAPEDFPEVARLELTRPEAEFLNDQWQQHGRGSLMAFLLARDRLDEEVDFPWQHPGVPAMRPELRRWLGHARNFSTLLHGAALLYNLLLAEASWAKLRRHEGLAQEYRLRLGKWAATVEANRSELGEWNRPEFWALGYEVNRRLPHASQSFAEDWFDCVLRSRSSRDILDDPDARALIARHETYLKRNRSRIRSSEHLQRWGGKAGTAQIDFRWGITQRLVADIQAGLGNA